jgi:C-22 sterol desaturase
MIIPSIYPSLHDPEVYPEPSALNPERWVDPNGSANQNPRNYLVFGSGPHKCIAYDYATLSLALVLANASVLMDWEHVRTSQSDEVQ